MKATYIVKELETKPEEFWRKFIVVNRKRPNTALKIFKIGYPRQVRTGERYGDWTSDPAEAKRRCRLLNWEKRNGYR